MLSAVLIIVIVVMYFNLQHRITKIEQLLGNRQPDTAPKPATTPLLDALEVPAPSTAIPPAMTPQAVATSSHHESTADQFVAWLRQDFLMKVGAGLLLLALGWFVTYAFMNNWIGPVGRITLGLLASVLVMIGGVWRLRYYPQQGSVLVALGAIGILITVFAARELYDMFSPGLALMMSFITAVFVAFVSVRYKRRPLAYAGLVIGSIAPMVINPVQPDTTVLFAYLLVVAVGTLWVVWQTGWTGLILASLGISSFYSLSYLFGALADRDVAIVFSFLFVSLYYVANIVSLVRRHGAGKHHMAVHTLVAGATALFLFAWIQTAIPPEWQSLVYVAWAMVFVFGTYVVYNFTANYAAFYLYGGTAVALIAFATAAELSGAVLAIAYTIELLVLLIALASILPMTSVVARTSILFVAPIILSLESLSYTTWNTVFGLDFAVLVILAGAMVATAIVLRSLITEDESTKDAKTMAGVLFSAATLYAAVIVWDLCILILSTSGPAVALVLYTIVGIGLIGVGQAHDSVFYRVAGGCFIGFVVLRLLLVPMPIELRIIAYAVIGVLLISTAFMGKKLRTQYEHDNG